MAIQHQFKREMSTCVKSKEVCTNNRYVLADKNISISLIVVSVKKQEINPQSTVQ